MDQGSPTESRGSAKKNGGLKMLGLLEMVISQVQGMFLEICTSQDVSLMWLRRNIFLRWRSDQQLLQFPNDLWQDLTCRDHDPGFRDGMDWLSPKASPTATSQYKLVKRLKEKPLFRAQSLNCLLSPN